MNVTFYADNIDPRVPEYQKKVFEALGLEIKQIKSDDWQGHGGEINRFLESLDPINDKEVITIWDIDCIPFNPQTVRSAVSDAEQGCIVGVAQKASHIANSIIYAGPAFLSFSMSTWRALGRPTFACTWRSDCGGELTHLAREKGVQVILLYPWHVEQPLWDLDGWVKFGKGTTFVGGIYHAFYSRKDNVGMFVDKCKEVLANLSDKR